MENLFFSQLENLYNEDKERVEEILKGLLNKETFEKIYKIVHKEKRGRKKLFTEDEANERIKESKKKYKEKMKIKIIA